MLLEKIYLTNFRQFFGNQAIEFSTDKDRNVTIILGENGSGKTTLEQAFTWCLYGDTDFEDKLVLNKKKAQELGPNDETVVKVELDILHGSKKYTLIREQKYTTDSTGMLKRPNNTVFKITFKNEDGQREFVKENYTEAQMNEILPKELSRYFFFDGERIEKMSKEIRKGKSQEFAEAVKRLLGLSAFSEALDHLDGRAQNTVMKSYVYDPNSDSKIAKYRDKIDEYTQALDKIEARLEDIENEELIAKEEIEKYETKIAENRDSERLARERAELKRRIEGMKIKKVNDAKAFLETFNNKASDWMSIKLIKDALQELANADKIDTGIPDIHARTIEYLIRRKKCICGNHIEFGNEAYAELNKILEYIPPKSIGTIIGQFVRECELKTRGATDTFTNMQNRFTELREFQTRHDELVDEVDQINSRIEGMENVGELQKKYTFYTAEAKKLQREQQKLYEEKGAITTKRERQETEMNELVLLDEKNKRVARLKAYAKYIHDYIDKFYKSKETETRNSLEKIVNKIFKKIYNGGFSLSIDEKYNIQVIVDDFEGYVGDVETSTAQSISVIFAFIAGVIQMARENNQEGNEMLVTEAYPLVMDAPLSAFDKTRIKTVCDALPKVAEQVIIFIKDTDGEIAEEHMGQKVGVKYMLEKKSEFETCLVGGR